MIHVNHTLRRMKIDRMGYDQFKGYWGAGLPMYEVQFRADGEIEVQSATLRAASRSDAVAKAKAIIGVHYNAVPSQFVLWRGNV